MAAPTLDDLKRLMQEWSEIDTNNVTLDTELDALGFESKSLAGLLIALQDEYDIELMPSDLAEIRSVGDIYEVLVLRAS